MNSLPLLAIGRAKLCNTHANADAYCTTILWTILVADLHMYVSPGAMQSIESFLHLSGESEGTLILNNERACSSVRPDAMATFLYGGRAALSRRLRLFRLLEDDPVFDSEDRHFQEQTKRFERAVEKCVHLIRKCQAAKIPWDDFLFLTNAIDEVMPLDVHTKMFIPALAHQTTPEQRDKYLPMAKEFRILGAYAQTELGHGSNVRALETVASYDPSTQEFVLHSPSLTSLKWWPGGLGKVATHAVVLARLMTCNKDCGIHSFLVQLRSLVDHKPLPGVCTGDIGPKMGFQSVDNGFLRLDHVRIPRDGMLMGLAEVTVEGEFRKKAGQGGEKVLYGAMLDVRAGLVERAAVTLARALTVAVRYSAVRKQGFSGASGSSSGRVELQVIDYPTQMHTLMPLLAWAYALQATGAYMHGKYREYLVDLDLRLLPEVHALSSGLKALAAKVVTDGIETCRKMCGGHGYSLFSGLPELVNTYVAVNTFEGTQQVLEPQTARYLLRIASGVPPSAPSKDLDYLARAAELIEVKCRATSGQELLDPSLQLEAFECRAAAMLALASQEVTELTSSGCSLTEAVNASGVTLGRLSRAHCQLVMFKRFHEAVHEQEKRVAGVQQGGSSAPCDVEVGPAEVRVLRCLCQLFALSVMEGSMADFRAHDYLDATQATLVSAEVMRMCRSIRLDAVALVDSWQLSDKLLNSALGREDGKVYEALLRMALRSPLNAQDITPTYYTQLIKLTQPCNGSSRL